MRFYATEKLGDKTMKTPEGFLVCLDVPIGRTGMMLYGPGETPIDVGPDGVARVDREPEELFKPETIASFNGKPVTNDHPPVDVNINNWRDLAMGFVTNPRRGVGANDDLLLADLVLTDESIIQDVQDGKRDVSSGYDNDYMQLGPGRGRQVNILGNHVALVDSGRCGSRCSIKDHSMNCKCEGESIMPVLFKEFKTKVKEAFKNSRSEKDLENALDELGVAARTKDEEGIHIHNENNKDLEDRMGQLEQKHQTHDEAINNHEERLIALEGDDEKKSKDNKSKDSIAKMVVDAVDAAFKARDKKAKDDEEEEERKRKEKEKTEDAVCPKCDGTGKVDGEECPECDGTGKVPDSMDAEVEKEEPKAKGAKDSAFLEDSYKNTVAIAEIISPGVRIPTFDKSAKPADTFVQVCGLRRKVLQLGTKDEEIREMITSANGGRTVDEAGIRRLACDQVRTLFFSVGALKKAANNNSSQDGTLAFSSAGVGGAKLSIAEINKRNRERKW